jgi:amino acid adenylation domain-containing protein
VRSHTAETDVISQQEPWQHARLLGRGPQRSVPAPSVDALFRAQARRTPDAAALRHGAQRLSYTQLDQRAESLAHELIERGVGPGELVALCMPRSLELVVALLAVMRTGAAYVPIDPEAPAARIRTVLQDSAPRLTLAGAGMEAPLRELGLPWMALDAATCRDGAWPRTRVYASEPDALAYVIFTSGSTGTPKGVEVRQLSLVNHALAMAELYAIGPSDCVLFSASVGFDVAAEQLYPALISGAQVVLRPDDLFSSFERFDQQLRAASISTLMLPTAFFHEWTRELDAGRLELPPRVRALGVGTEAVSSALLGRFLEHARGRVRFLQGYGPTETTITCTAYVHDGRSFAPGEAVPIGLPLPNTEAYVLDEHMGLIADGEVGELYVGGVGLARGYLGRPELTRERFVPHPFASEAGARLYRTGDLVRRAADGQLSFVGRADFQIKVRGHRVEPSEIERVLCDQPGISEALVMLRQREQGNPRLVAYVVSAQPLAAAALGAACRAQLPSYMVPDAFVALPAFPKTLNQKVDRNALPEPAPDTAREKRAARNDLELLLTRAFAEVLGVSEPCIEDDFFALGGNSLRALRLLQLIRQSCSGQLGLADIFAAPSVAALSARIAQGGTLDRATVLCLKPGRGTPLFLVCGIHIYQALADALSAPNPVYALLLPSEASVTGEGLALPAIERLAFEYLQVLREHTPRGPYALGGLSFGGAVAYEMARQLEAAEETVTVVGLFDTALPRGRLRSARVWLRRRARSLLTRAVSRLAGAHDQRISSVPEQLLALEQRRQRAYGERLVDYDRASKPYGGRVVLYRALDADEGPLLPGHGFEQLAPRLALCDVPGDHLGILRDAGVRRLAAHLSCEITQSPGVSCA